MRFIADAMLGRLARWLRLVGFDTLYFRDISDSVLLKIALKEHRFILTKDTHFLRMRSQKECLLITSDNPIEQLSEVIRALNPVFPERGRCAGCNGELLDVKTKTEIQNAVPEYVYMNYSRFLRCGDCGNIYWEGSQYRRFKEMLSCIMEDIQK
jgi:uncharacterized protein with PIN domain